MDRWRISAALFIAAALFGTAAFLSSAAPLPVSQDPSLTAFNGMAGQQQPGLVPVQAETVGPWRVRQAAVFPAEAASAVEDDALVLVPERVDGTASAASLRQDVTLPRGDLRLRVEARNAALLAGEPVTYWREYCADSIVNVSIHSRTGGEEREASRLVSHGTTTITLDASAFAGEAVTLTTSAGYGNSTCGIERTNLVHISFFGVERQP